MKRFLSGLLIIALLLQLTACGLVDTAKHAANSAASGISSAKDSVVNWYENIDLTKFRDGWDAAVDYMGSAYSAAMSNAYVERVGEAINSFKTSMNSAYGSARGVAQEAGFAAEKWVAGTFNINAAANESQYHADVVGSTELGSVDVATNYGEDASLKFYSSSSGSAGAQAKTLIEAYREYYTRAQSNTTKPPMSLKEYLDSKGFDAESQDALLSSIYDGQTRIIPAEQLSEAIEFLEGRIDKLSAIDGEVASARTKSYQETLFNLRDRLHAPDGTESKPITNEEIQAIAELSQRGEFKPEDFHVSLSTVIDPRYVMKQAMGTGLEVGVLKTVFTVGPDLVSVVLDAAKSGNIDETQLKELGIDGTIALSEGFVEGSVSRIIVTMCKEGLLGEALKSAPSDIVGALVFLTIEAMIEGYSLVKGTITPTEYGCLMADKSLITALAIPTSALMLSILPATKLFMLIGCFAGGIIAATGYTVAKEVVVEVIDGGGFEAFAPAGTAKGISSLKEKIAAIDFKEQFSNLKEFTVSTVNSGYIRVKSILS